MLPTGHIAAGYLIGKFALPGLFEEPYDFLPALTAAFAFSPDLDSFYSFARTRRWTMDFVKADHRRFLPHTPAVSLLAGLAVMLSVDMQIGISLIFGTWSHYLLDSIQHGIRWGWPVSKKLFALLDAGANEERRSIDPTLPFLSFWSKFLRYYVRQPSFIGEFIIVLIGLMVFVYS